MRELFDAGCEAIAARSEWENRQRVYDQMRHEGLRRRGKPWPTAADLHFPLVDMTIRKAKPFWEAQALSADRLASFVALRDQQQATTTAAADFFDWQLRQESNFGVSLLRAVDYLLLRGRGVFRMVVDPFDDYRIVCRGIDSMYVLISDGADDFEDSDWFIHVQHMSVNSYKRNRRYNQDPDVIRQIRGQPELDISSGLLEDKQAREGVNYTQNANRIILWEHWVRTMGGWTIHTYSPLAPDADVRKPHGCPYKIGGKPSIPFFSFKTEVKDEGWFSPRGVAELSAAFESYSCKLWNEKSDAITFGNRPVFTADQQIPDSANVRWVPGEFIPGNVRQVQMAGPVYSFDQEIAFARGIAEQQNMLPDFGLVQPGMLNEASGPRTATENNRIATLQTVGTESQGRLFRLDLAKVFRHAWALMLQFKRPNLIYYVGGELKTLPEQALHDAYMIQPDGSPDAWNRQQRMQRAMVRLQTYKGAPNVDQDVLVRGAMAADDPKFAQEAFIPANEMSAREAEDEAMEIVIMADGFPASVKPNEDHATRIHVLLSWLQKQSAMGAPVNPVARQRVQEHLAIHWAYLKKLQPQAAAQVKQQIQQMEQAPAPGPGGPGPMGLPAGPGAQHGPTGAPTGPMLPGSATPAMPPPAAGEM